VGGSDVVDAAVFEGFDYVALGHLHRPQEIGGNPAIAYSGSPIPYSFSEDHQKSVRLVEIDETGFIGATTIPIPVGRPVKVLTDSMSNLLECPEYGAFVGHWISAKLTDELAQVEPMRRLRDRFPHVASVSYDNTRRSGAVGPDDGSVDIATRHPSEVVRDFVADLQGRVVTSAEDELIVQGLALLAERADG
jgi:exonuclease SbcD